MLLEARLAAKKAYQRFPGWCSGMTCSGCGMNELVTERELCCAGSVRTVETLDQRYVLMPAAVKDAYLVHIVHEYLQKNSSSSVMIFTNTCKSVPFSLSVCVRFKICL